MRKSVVIGIIGIVGTLSASTFAISRFVQSATDCKQTGFSIFGSQLVNGSAGVLTAVCPIDQDLMLPVLDEVRVATVAGAGQVSCLLRDGQGNVYGPDVPAAADGVIRFQQDRNNNVGGYAVHCSAPPNSRILYTYRAFK
jgi:hypothetical protein